MTTTVYTKQKLLKQFTALGPYIREQQCHDQHYFFDCLAVCVNVKVAPEKREFWGWWLTLEPTGDASAFCYCYRLGIYNKAGQWQEMPINVADMRQKIFVTLTNFHQRLQQMADQMAITLHASADSEPFADNVTQ